MGCPEIDVGVFPFMISALIYRSVPRAKANELMMTGRLMTAEEARDYGLVDQVIHSALQAADEGRPARKD